MHVHTYIHTYVAIYICMTITKTRTGLGLDWRWTRTFMCFLWFCTLLSTFLTTRGRLTCATNIFYFICILIFNIPVLEWVEQVSQICYFVVWEILLLHHPKLATHFLPLVEPASIRVHTFKRNWLTCFVTLYVMVFEQKQWDWMRLTA